MGVIYTDPPEYTDETPTVAESMNECQWLGIDFGEDGYTDDVDLEEKGSGVVPTGTFDNDTNPYEDDIDEIYRGETS